MDGLVDFDDSDNKISAAEATVGPRVDFLEAYSNSFEQQQRTSAQYGLHHAFRELEAKQIKSLREAGEQNIPTLVPDMLDDDVMSGIRATPGVKGINEYMETSRFYALGGEPEKQKQLQDYDTQVDALRKKYPNLGLMNSREMFDEMVRRGQEAERVANEQRGGFFGSLAGGAVASMNMDTDPLNLATLGVGGVGKTAVMRIATEAGAQGIIEGLNQITGVQEQREIMGLSHGTADALMRVGTTAIGGAGFQAIGEGAAAGFKYAGKRWFNSTGAADPIPSPPPIEQKPLLLEYKPEQPGQNTRIPYSTDDARLAANMQYNEVLRAATPYGSTPRAVARAVSDVEAVAAKLEAWDGESPLNITPRSSTALPTEVRMNAAPEIKIQSPGRTLDELARDVDPKLFKQYDELADRANEYRRWLGEMRPDNAKLDVEITDLQARIDNLKYKMAKLGKRKQANLQPELDDLEAQIGKKRANAGGRDTPEMSRVRQELIRTDEKMRDFAPLVTRAYAQARNEWDLGEADRELVRQMVREGRKDLPQQKPSPLQDTYENTLNRMARKPEGPILSQRSSVAVKQGADDADVATAIIKKNVADMEVALNNYRANLSKILTEENASGEISIAGSDHKFNLDKDTIRIENEDGVGFRDVTLRELLEDNVDAEENMKAVQVCSLK